MAPITIIIENEKFRSQVEYTFRTLFSILGTMDHTFQAGTGSLVTIYYGHRAPVDKTPSIIITPAATFWDNYATQASLPAGVHWHKEIPVLYTGTSRQVEQGAKKISTDLDIIASTFFMLSRYEEFYQPKKLDKHHRFPAHESVAFKNKFLDKPVVNMYAELLRTWIGTLIPGKCHFDNNHWAGKDFAFCMTHDVDTIAGKQWFDTIKDDIKNMVKARPIGLYEFIIHNVQYATGNNPADTFNFLRSMGRRYDIPSTYFFMTSRRHPEYDVNEYDIFSPDIHHLLTTLRNDGHEIGLHGSYPSFDSLQFLTDETKSLMNVSGQKECGIRQHYLRFDIPNTWKYQHEAKLAYDSSLGFADHDGFRAGICHPFHPFDLATNRELPSWEIPLIWMEGSVINYRKLQGQSIIENFQQYLDICEKYHGVFTVLWHNATFSHHEWRTLYQKCLEKAQHKNCLCTTMNKALKLFRNKS